MSSMEIELVMFTVLSQSAIGLVLMSSVRQYAVEGPAGNVRSEWIVAGAILLLGLIASFFHLGHPLGAINAIKHIGSSWLSREAVGISLFLALVAAGIFSSGERIKFGLAVGACFMGLLALFFTGMTYAPPGYPALYNVLPLVFFVLTAVTVGTAFSSYFAPEVYIRTLAAVLAAALVVSLVVYLVVPLVWLSGGTVMSQTGIQHLTSPLYWGKIILGLVIPLGAVAMTRSIPYWVPVLIIIGEFMGRIAFFALSVHASSNIGGL